MRRRGRWFSCILNRAEKLLHNPLSEKVVVFRELSIISAKQALKKISAYSSALPPWSHLLELSGLAKKRRGGPESCSIKWTSKSFQRKKKKEELIPYALRWNHLGFTSLCSPPGTICLEAMTMFTLWFWSRQTNGSNLTPLKALVISSRLICWKKK